MRIVAQRVKRASVSVGGETLSSINKGLLVLIGVQEGDTDADARYIAGKIAGLRVFPDADGKMNLPLTEAGGSVLLVSQFTLLGDARKGNRPSFIQAAAPEEADHKYLLVAELLRGQGIEVGTGQFQAHMDVELVNDGPVTILIDSRRTF